MKEVAIAVYGREFNESVIGYVEELFNYLRQKEVEVYIYAPFYDFLKRQCTFPYTFHEFHSHRDLPGTLRSCSASEGTGRCFPPLH